MGDPQQQIERARGEPPEGRTDPDQIEQQCERLERHHDKGRKRNRDDVGKSAINARLVKMKQPDRDQRQLDQKPGEQERQQVAADRRKARLLARSEPCLDARMLVQRNDCRDRGERELEA